MLVIISNMSRLSGRSSGDLVTKKLTSVYLILRLETQSYFPQKSFHLFRILTPAKTRLQHVLIIH